MGYSGQQFLTATVMVWVGATNLVFCSGYKAHTIFQNLQQRTLTCRERGALQTYCQLR
jgi:hypothetical protein